ncbi:hypothetical protein ABH920_004472 [Catenulispora sp. EB89]|uniref:hypothetical protein n=1 Tax=Catenulispora sp. EB89 TaxID=3156257 RepID=UPI00351337E3
MLVTTRRRAAVAVVAGLISMAVPTTVHAATPTDSSHWNCSEVAPISGGRVVGVDCYGSGRGPGVIFAGAVAYHCQAFEPGSLVNGLECTAVP